VLAVVEHAWHATHSRFRHKVWGGGGLPLLLLGTRTYIAACTAPCCVRQRCQQDVTQKYVCPLTESV